MTKGGKKMLYYLIAIVLLILVVFFLGTVPLIKKVYMQRDGFEEKKLKIEEINREQSQFDSFNEKKQLLDENIEMIERAMIKENNQVDFIQYLEKIGINEGLTVQTKTYTPPKEKKKKANQEEETIVGEEKTSETRQQKETLNYLMLNVTGHYDQVINYLYRLQNSVYVFNLNSVELNLIENQIDKYNQSTKKLENFDPADIEAIIIVSFPK